MERLTTEINYWESQAEKWLQQKQEKQNARKNFNDARRKADDIKVRMQKRLEELEKERQLLPQPPLIVGGALIVPAGLIRRLNDDDTVPPTFATEKERVEKLAMEAVMAVEKALSFEPKDVSADKCGYDIESLDPITGHLRFIEVKGRISGAQTVTVTKNEIFTALNKPDAFILALVEVPQSGKWSEQNCGIRYVLRPFHSSPDFAVTSVNYNWQKLWNQGEQPHK